MTYADGLSAELRALAERRGYLRGLEDAAKAVGTVEPNENNTNSYKLAFYDGVELAGDAICALAKEPMT